MSEITNIGPTNIDTYGSWPATVRASTDTIEIEVPNREVGLGLARVIGPHAKYVYETSWNMHFVEIIRSS